MGLFNFAEDVGHKIAGNAAASLAENLHGLDMPTDGVEVEFENGKAVLKGTVADKDTAEKLILALGNHQGVGTVDDQLTIAGGDPGPQSVFVTVERGDTLSGISLRVYGVYHLYNMIFGANVPMIKDADEIFPGQVLRIPPAPAFVSHTVKSGETLGKIAKWWTGKSSNWQAIFNANRDVLDDANAIEVGQTLKIPVKQQALNA